jgi:hypothetical protein
MSTGANLAALIADVQFELGHSVSTSIGQQFRGHIVNRIQREYERLYRDFSWPHLRQWIDMPTVAGQKLYTLPVVNTAQLTIEDLREVYARNGGIFDPLGRGIEINDYNAMDSDAGQWSDPALKWEPRSERMIELWPCPAISGEVIRMKAISPFKQLVDDGDICRLDDQLVVLHAAGEYLMRQSSKDATAVLGRAQAHYATLKQRYQTGANRVQLAQGDNSNYGPNDPRKKVFVGVQTKSG